MVLPDFVGFGLSAKPDHRYSIRGAADTIEGVAAALGLTEVDLLSHDMGDSVAGELLARDLDGELGFSVRRRVLTNGSIYLDLAQLTTGQQLLLSLPDEAVQISDEERYTESLAATCAPEHRPSDEELAAQWQLLTHNGGDSLLARTIRYIEDRRAEERRYTGRHRGAPVAARDRVGRARPDRRPRHDRPPARACAPTPPAPPSPASATTRWSRRRSGSPPPSSAPSTEKRHPRRCRSRA